MPRPRPRPVRRGLNVGYHGAQADPGDGYQPRPVAPGRAGVPAPAPAAAPGAAPANPYDFSVDPILQRIKAFGEQSVRDAEAEALRYRKQLAIDYGDADLARSLGLDDATIAAAGSNALSTRAKLGRERVARPKALDEQLNDRDNLFYSGARIKQQGDLSTALLDQENTARGAVQGRFSDIESALTSARSAAAERNIGGEEDAADRLRERLGDRPYGPAAPGALGPASRAAGRIRAPLPAARRAAGRIRPPAAIARRGIGY